MSSVGSKLFCCENIPVAAATPDEDPDMLDNDWTAGCDCDARSLTDGAVTSSALVAGSPAATGLSGTAALAACAAHDDSGATAA